MLWCVVVEKENKFCQLVDDHRCLRLKEILSHKLSSVSLINLGGLFNDCQNWRVDCRISNIQIVIHLFIVSQMFIARINVIDEICIIVFEEQNKKKIVKLHKLLNNENKKRNIVVLFGLIIWVIILAILVRHRSM